VSTSPNRATKSFGGYGSFPDAGATRTKVFLPDDYWIYTVFTEDTTVRIFTIKFELVQNPNR